MKRILLTGLAAIAALGLSCARVTPVYSQTNIFTQAADKHIAIESNAEEFSIMLYHMENGEIVSEMEYTRVEPRNGIECLSEQLILQNETGFLRRLDNRCNMTVDELQDSQYPYIFTRNEFPDADTEDWVYAEDLDLAKRLLDINNEVSNWHERKGL
jgi:hypothetical protein